jgi:hypothetical protein
MPLVNGRICREAIEIFLSVDVGHPSTLRFVNNDVEGTVVVSAVSLFE